MLVSFIFKNGANFPFAPPGYTTVEGNIQVCENSISLNFIPVSKEPQQKYTEIQQLS